MRLYEKLILAREFATQLSSERRLMVQVLVQPRSKTLTLPCRTMLERTKPTYIIRYHHNYWC
jgi:hypothetical protein